MQSNKLTTILARDQEIINIVSEECVREADGPIMRIPNLYAIAHPLKSLLLDTKWVKKFLSVDLPYKNFIDQYEQLKLHFSTMKSPEKLTSVLNLLREELKHTNLNTLNKNLDKHHYKRMVAYTLQQLIRRFTELAIQRKITLFDNIPFLQHLSVHIKKGMHAEAFGYSQILRGTIYNDMFDISHGNTNHDNHILMNVCRSGSWAHIRWASQFPGISLDFETQGQTFLMALDWSSLNAGIDYFTLNKLIKGDKATLKSYERCEKILQQTLFYSQRVSMFLMLQGFSLSKALQVRVNNTEWQPLISLFNKLQTLEDKSQHSTLFSKFIKTKNPNKMFFIRNLKKQCINDCHFDFPSLYPYLSQEDKKSFCVFFIAMRLISWGKMNNIFIRKEVTVPRPILSLIGNELLPQDVKWCAFFSSCPQKVLENKIARASMQ